MKGFAERKCIMTIEILSRMKQLRADICRESRLKACTTERIQIASSRVIQSPRSRPISRAGTRKQESSEKVSATHLKHSRSLASSGLAPLPTKTLKDSLLQSGEETSFISRGLATRFDYVPELQAPRLTLPTATVPKHNTNLLCLNSPFAIQPHRDQIPSPSNSLLLVKELDTVKDRVKELEGLVYALKRVQIHPN